MDFSQVKAITIPEGNVSRLLSGSTVLWEKGGDFPSGYQLVRYIESTGTQYIDTGYCPNQDTVLTGEYYSKNRTGVVAFARWSGAPEYDTFGLYIGGTGLTTVYYGRYSNNKYTGNIGGMVGDIVDINIGINSVSLNSNTYNITREQFQSPYSLYLFGGNNMGTLSNLAYCKIYRMTITENNTTMRDFVPCYRKSDGKPGLYDKVTNTFYTNQGTGEFIIGPEIYPIPSSYQQVTYLESDGTQYINTLIPISTITASDFECELAITSNDTMITFGTRTTTFKQMVLVSGKVRNDWINGRTTSYLTSTPLIIGTRYIMSQQNSVFECSTSSANVTTSTNSDIPFAIFARMGRNTDDDGLPHLEAHMRLYSFVAKSGETLICNFVPCYRKSDNVAGLYDTVSDQFYANAGTGDFTIGEIVTEENMIFRKQTYAITRNQYVDASGNIQPYNGWDMIDNIDVGDSGLVIFKGIDSGHLAYCSLYSSSMTRVSGVSGKSSVITIDGSDYYLVNTRGAKYMRLSGERSEVAATEVYLHDEGEFKLVQ